MATEKLQLYLHIPFCVRKCAYCDFLSFPAAEEIRKEYVNVLIRQIQQSGLEKRQVSSVFFGGGTPSILAGEEVARLMEAVRASFCLMDDAEITMEANPGTLDQEKLTLLKRAGMNRLSIGLQSANENELKILGRIHSLDQFLENYRAARMAGFDNINVDLMSALPGQTVESWRETLERVLALEPEHISAYSLIVEEGTPFYQRYREEVRRREEGEECKLLPSEEEERQMYHETEKILSEAGYKRYEISNYAKPGYECRHNIGYWRRREYLGLGLGAASFMGKERFCMTRDLDAYLKGDFEKKERQLLSRQEEMEEFMFLGLRLKAGIHKMEFEREFGEDYQKIYGDVTRKMEGLGLLETVDEWVRLTERGMDVGNYVMAEFLF